MLLGLLEFFKDFDFLIEYYDLVVNFQLLELEGCLSDGEGEAALDAVQLLVRGSLTGIPLEILMNTITQNRDHQVIKCHIVVSTELLHLYQRAPQIKLANSSLLATQRFGYLEWIFVVTTPKNFNGLHQHDEWCN